MRSRDGFSESQLLRGEIEIVLEEARSIALEALVERVDASLEDVETEIDDLVQEGKVTRGRGPYEGRVYWQSRSWQSGRDGYR